jgi:hypothetical protein
LQWKKVSRGARKRGNGEEEEEDDDDVGKEIGNKRGSENMQATEQSAVHDGGVSSESRSGMHRAPSVDDLFAPMFRLDVQSSENRLNNNAREGVTTAPRGGGGGGGGAGVVVGGGGGDGSGSSSGSVAVNKNSVPGFGVASLKEGSEQGGAIGTRHSAVAASAASGGKHLVFVPSLSLSPQVWSFGCVVFFVQIAAGIAELFQPNRLELTGCYYKLLQTWLYPEVRPS